jgi:hypothetical protein
MKSFDLLIAYIIRPNVRTDDMLLSFLRLLGAGA